MVRLDVWADIACPWCWIGHARLRRALARQAPGSVVVRPRAFELRPDLPPEGRPAAHASPVLDRIAAEARDEGLELRFDRIRVTPSTRLAHRLVALGEREAGRGLPALDALFAAHLRDGLDVGDPACACTVVAAATGLDADALAAALDAGDGLAEVLADEEAAAELGVTAVPCFAIAGSGIALSGAHEPALLGKLLAAARRRAA